MNRKAIMGVVGGIVVVAVLYLGYQYLALRREAVKWAGPIKEIAGEKMEKVGDTWHIEFLSQFDAPVDKVYEAYTHPERARELNPERVLLSELKRSGDNTKVVEIHGRVLNLPTQVLLIEYTFHPGEKRITTRTLDYNLADISSEYRFEPSPDGARTLLRFTQTSKDKLGNPLPQAVQESALKEIYVTQVRVVKKALGLAAPS
jgi:hypothetical protein